MPQDADPSAASIVAFCRFARSNGLAVGINDTIAAIEAAGAVGFANWELFTFALRAVLCSSQEEWELFDGVFRAYWNSARTQAEAESEKDQPLRHKVTQKSATESEMLIGMASSEAAAREVVGKMIAGASSQQRLRKIDFSEISQADLAALEQLSLRLLRRMSVRLSRRMKIESTSDRVDLRRTIRRNVSNGGEPFSLAFQGRKPRKNRLVIFLDISRSMNLYSLFLVRFAYALQKYFKQVNTFLFSTSVVEVSDVLKARKLAEALGRLSQRVPEWPGGTKIGGSLREFNRRFSRKVLTRNTVFIILSDGWDTGAPKLLAAELLNARRRVQKLLWLNPLLGLKEYQPVTRAMSAALPYVDVFAPAHNLESLLALEKYL